MASDAIQAAAEVQQSMLASSFDEVGELLVRIGIHTGSAELRGGDYFGPDVNLAARIMSAGHGRQILLSDTTTALATGTDTLDLGRHHFRGIREPRAIRQLVADGLPAEFPPLRTRSTPTTNLPEPRSALIGRHDEVIDVTKALAEHRLVTLIGPGGVGKTSLAIEVARGLAPGDGTWFVDLTPVTSEEHLAIAFADAIGLAESGTRPLADQVASHVRDLETVLVVDNREHVIDGAAGLIGDIVTTAPSVRILATSREVLEIPDEAVIAVPPLPLPDADATTLDTRASAPLQLLEARAAAAGGDSEFLDSNLDAALEVCRLVDGLPLAIELAAARLRSMSIEELAAHLRDRLSILAAGRGRHARHRTLESVIEWSHDLLAEDERRAFAGLAVFSGGFTAAAAASVLGELGGIDMLARLVDKSLVFTESTDARTRYRMLETLKMFAVDRLGRGDRDAPTRDAHLAWSLELIDQLERDMRTPSQDATLRAIRPEHDNLRAARAWAEGGDPVATLRITASAPIDSHDDRQQRLSLLLDRAVEAPTELRARARYTALGAAFEGGDFADGVTQGREAMHLYEELDDKAQLAYSRMMTAFCLWGSGEFDEVGHHLEQSLAEFDELDDTMGRAYLNWCISQWQLHAGENHEESAARAHLAVELFSEVDSPFGRAHAVEGIGHLLAAQGDLDHAMAHMVDAFDRLHAMGHTGCMAHALDGVAFVLVQAKDLIGGAEFVGAAERLRNDAGAAARPWEIDATARCLQDLRTGLSSEALEAALTTGRTLGLPEILSRVDALAPH